VPTLLSKLPFQPLWLPVLSFALLSTVVPGQSPKAPLAANANSVEQSSKPTLPRLHASLPKSTPLSSSRRETEKSPTPPTGRYANFRCSLAMTPADPRILRSLTTAGSWLSYTALRRATVSSRSTIFPPARSAPFSIFHTLRSNYPGRGTTRRLLTPDGTNSMCRFKPLHSETARSAQSFPQIGSLSRASPQAPH